MMKISYKFNMVEIALAIVVLAIGISSILVLFPIGINASRAAMEENMAPEIEEFVVNYARNEFLKFWLNQKSSNTFTAPSLFGSTYPVSSSNPEFLADFNKTDGETEVDSVEVSKKDGTTGTVKAAQLFSKGNGLYKYVRNTDDGQRVAMVKIWRPADDLTSDTNNGACPLYVPQIVGRTGNRPQSTATELKYLKDGVDEESLTTVFNSFAQSVLVEISWGGEDYSERKRTFRVDVYNPYFRITS